MKKGFTLIELMAVMIVLAIIILIATPITVNMIENAKKNTAKQSAIGYVKAVNTHAMDYMVNGDNSLESGTFTVSELGDRIKTNGSKPESGWVRIEDGDVNAYSLTINGYIISWSRGNKVVIKKSGEPSLPTMEEMCPGCVYIYTADELHYGGDDATVLTSSQYKTNYQDVINETGKNYFLGAKLNETTNKIEKMYACGIRNGNPFCLEGTTDGSTYTTNKNILTNFYTKDYISLGNLKNYDSYVAYALMNKGYVSSIEDLENIELFIQTVDGMCFDSSSDTVFNCYVESMVEINSSGSIEISSFGYNSIWERHCVVDPNSYVSTGGAAYCSSLN